MRSLTTFFVLLASTSVSLVHAQSTPTASQGNGSNGASATKEEVDELRGEVAAQRKTIEELKALVEKLVDAKSGATGDTATPTRAAESKDNSRPNSNSSTNVLPVAAARAPNPPQPVADPGDSGVHLRNAVLLEPDPAAVAAMVDQAAPAAPPKRDVPLNAGWNGEHFFIRSSDGQFSISPYGYVDTDYRAYKGDGSPSDTFLVRRARFGFQGNYGSHFDFAILTDAASTTGSIVRDAYVNVRFRPEIQFQAGQFKVPFGQEAGTGATNLDFIERGFQAMLYPSAATAFRSPGAMLHGDIDGGVVQYFLGAFNGRGYSTASVVNESEIIGRLRFYPFRKSENSWFREFAFGGSVDHADSRGLSGDQSFSGALPNAAFSFFPQFPINGPIWRYNGEFTYIRNAFALRGEYDQVRLDRNGIGSLQEGNLGFMSLPGITGKAYDVSATYILTREKQPENGTPRVRHPTFGPDTPGGQGRGLGAWEVAARITGLHANEPGTNLLNLYTPGYVATFDYHTTEYTIGLNYYPNYWVKYMVNLAIDQLKDPSTIGALPQNYYVVMQRLQFRF